MISNYVGYVPLPMFYFWCRSEIQDGPPVCEFNMSCDRGKKDLRTNNGNGKCHQSSFWYTYTCLYEGVSSLVGLKCYIYCNLKKTIHNNQKCKCNFIW